MSSLQGISGGSNRWSVATALRKIGATDSTRIDDLFAKVDTDGDGQISGTELAAGVKSLVPPPASTVDFAARRDGGGLFGKLDGDASGGLDADELQTLVDKMAAHRGADAPADAPTSGAQLLAKLDTDGDGSVSQAELEAGRPKASEHGGSGPEGTRGGPPPHGGGHRAGGSSGSGDSSSTSTDPLDTNGDGVVSIQERAAGDLEALIAGLAAAMTSKSADGSDAAPTSLSVTA